MELSANAKKIITNAQSFRVENNHNSLCIEHLLYGVLLLGRESSYDGRKVREFLDREMDNPDVALTQLKMEAKDLEQYFRDAAPVLGRATELSGGGEIGAMHLAQAVLESKTPTVIKLKKMRNVVDPGKRQPEPAQRQPQPAQRQPQPAQRQPEPAQRQPQPAQRQPEPAQNGKELSANDLALLLMLMAAASNNQKEELVHNTGSRGGRGNGPKVKRRTKMGLFTYRGGTVAAAFQYFLFGILIPVAVVALVQRFTGFLNKPATPILMFVTGTLFCLWVFYLARGVALLFGMASGALGNFLNIVCDVTLIVALMKVIQLSWNMPVVPMWLRIIVSIAILLVLMIGTTLYEYLKDGGRVGNARFTFMNLKGSPSKIFFQYVTKIMVYPFVIFAIIWIFRLTLPGWLSKAFMIFGFGYFWNILNTACSCLVISSELRGGGGKKFLIFLKNFVTFMFIPAFVMYLHKIFMWSPAKTWVMIVLAIYILLTTILSIVYAAQQ